MPADIAMPAELRCDVYVTFEGDPTGENAVQCNAIALPCADCGESAGCEEHAVRCPRCGKPVCDYCADEHRRVATATVGRVVPCEAVALSCVDCSGRLHRARPFLSGMRESRL